MAELSPLDRDLLYLLIEAEKNGETPASAWQLASKRARSTAETNILEGIFRYHLEKLVKKGIIQKKKYRKGKSRYTRYSLRKKMLCINGSVILMANPLLIFECPHVAECRSKCRIDFYKIKGKTVIRGCKLLQKAPVYIKELVLKHLETAP